MNAVLMLLIGAIGADASVLLAASPTVATVAASSQAEIASNGCTCGRQQACVRGCAQRADANRRITAPCRHCAMHGHTPLLHRASQWYPAAHTAYYRKPYDYRLAFDYPWHAPRSQTPATMFLGPPIERPSP